MNQAAITFQEVNYFVDGLHILKNITGSFPDGKITNPAQGNPLCLNYVTDYVLLIQGKS